MRGWPKITDQDQGWNGHSQLSFLLSFVSVSNFWKKLAQAKESWYQTSETKVKVGKAGTKGASQNAPIRRDGTFIRRAFSPQSSEMEHSSGAPFLLQSSLSPYVIR
jgi:hypothetical protein